MTSCPAMSPATRGIQGERPRCPHERRGQELRIDHGRRRIGPGGAGRDVPRPARSERSGQVHHHAHAHRAEQGGQRYRRGLRAPTARGVPSRPVPDRRRAAARQPRLRTVGPTEPRRLRPARGRARARMPCPRRPGAGRRAPHRPGRHRVDALSGGMRRRLLLARGTLLSPACCCSTNPPSASTRRSARTSGTSSRNCGRAAPPS